MTIRALLAEDEPLLAETLLRNLKGHWPELDVVGVAPNGTSAVELALAQLPEILFFDIRMPGKSGLEAAAEVLDGWPHDHAPPLVVFVTAYDEFAVAAFEQAAVDFVLKPVSSERIARTVARLRERLAERGVPAEGDAAAMLRTVQTLSLEPDGPGEPLTVLNVGSGNTVHMVPIDEVLYFEATDKYVSVVTADREGLIRISMRELLCRMPGNTFMQIHRSVVVNRRAILSASRNDLGHVTLTLRGVTRSLAVSRAFSHHFRPM
jgi:DNA-binding LytR/AlgR family response regulator